MYTTLIVDDEIQQQEMLADMMGKHFPDYRVAGICSGVDEGLQKIQQLKPQLVFLDVVMPPKNGFDLLDELKEINFEIIFTTSHEQFAIRAFKVSAVDYLLKPFGESELRVAVEKFEQRVAQKNSLQHIQTLLHNIHSRTSDKIKIALPTMEGYIFAEVGTIIRCESDNAYTTFYFADKSKVLVSRSLKDCEELLEQYGFFRTHTSHFINMRFVKEYIKGDGGYVKMTDGSVAEVSRLRKNDFLQSLQKL
jgi:two-component system LytT family response regulator